MQQGRPGDAKRGQAPYAIFVKNKRIVTNIIKILRKAAELHGENKAKEYNYSVTLQGIAKIGGMKGLLTRKGRPLNEPIESERGW